jgi:predicted MFS family arabinose efflux permease
MTINSNNRKMIHFLLWLSITLFYCYQYILRTIPNIIMQDMMQKYAIGAGEFGSFAGIYYIGYIAVHIPVGILLTRFGAKKILPLFITLTALGAAPLVYSDNWHLVLLGRLCTGIGTSAAAVGALQIFRAVYPEKFSTILGFTILCGLITAVYVTAPLDSIIRNIGFNNTVNLLLLLGVTIAIFTYILMPNMDSGDKKHSIWRDLKAVLMNPILIITSIAAGLMVGPIEGFADAWGSAFMVSIYKLDKSVADYFSLSIYTGMAIGCVILPYIADKTKMTMMVTIASALTMATCFFQLTSGAIDVEYLYYLCILIGIFSAYQVVIIAKITTFVSLELSGLAASVANMFIMGFGWFFHISIGNSLESTWSGQFNEQRLKCYAPESFIQAVQIIPLSGLMAAVILSLVVFYQWRQHRAS